jgi:hypothetical protein
MSEAKLAALASLLMALEELRRIEVARSEAGMTYTHLQLVHDLVTDIRTIAKGETK